MKKQIKIKIVILIIAFLAMSVSTFLSLYYNKTEPSVTTMRAAALPIVYMQTPGGIMINPAKGYLSEVNGRALFNGITPLDENRNVTAVIYQYSEKVNGMSYRVVDLETGKLLEDTVVELEPQLKEEYFSASMNIKNLIEKNKQYLLEIRLTTREHERISYFQRILWADNLDVDEKIGYTLQFNAYTYSAADLSEIERWIETDGTGDNTNYGHVGIHSTAEQIGWGALQPKVEGDIVPRILEINESVAQIALFYRVATLCTALTYDLYDVEEYYRIRQVNGEFYLLSYDRRANQRFDGNEDLQASGRINLGIKDGGNVCEAMSDDKGMYSYFADSGQLWCYARNDNKFTNVFSFAPIDDLRVRDWTQDYKIKLVSVDGDGRADFMVAGYMSRGEHEGSTGISLYSYEYKDNVVNEVLFIPVPMTFDEMEKEVGDVVFLSQEQFFVKVGSILYSVDLASREIMTVTDNLYSQTYTVTEDQTRLAYHYSHSAEDEKQIRVLDFETGTEYIIDAEKYGNKSKYNRLRLIGFLEQDMVFGVFDVRDVTAPDGINTVLPMYGIYILDSSYELVKEYRQANIFVTQASIEGMRVNLTRLIKNEEGRLVPAAIDQLMNRKENNAKGGMYTEIVVTEARKKEIYLYLASSAGNTNEVSLRYSKEVIYDPEAVISLEAAQEREQRFYAYGYGRCLGVYDSLMQGVRAASAKEGFVLDSSGNCLWHRTQRSNTNVWNDIYAERPLSDYTENLTGLSLQNILYFISDGKFVLARKGEESFAILYDYDNTNVYYYDRDLAKSVVMPRDAAEKMFVEWGNVFLTIP